MTKLVLFVAVMLVGTYLPPAHARTPQLTPSGLQSAKPAFAFPNPNISSADEDGWVALKTTEGVLFVWNMRGLYFTLAIKGNEIKPVENPNHIFFDVDGKILQIQVTAISNFAPDAKEKRLDDKAVLAAHRDWESKYIEGLVSSKLKVRTFNARLSSGVDASMWQFDMPEGMSTVATKQLYLTLVTKDYVVMLNSEATATISDDDGRKFLLETISTLKVSPSPLDVKKIAESISKTVTP